MNKWLEILIGLVLVAIPVYAWGIDFWGVGVAALVFLKGGLVWLLLMVGILFILLGISDLKE